MYLFYSLLDVVFRTVDRTCMNVPDWEDVKSLWSYRGCRTIVYTFLYNFDFGLLILPNIFLAYFAIHDQQQRLAVSPVGNSRYIRLSSGHPLPQLSQGTKEIGLPLFVIPYHPQAVFLRHPLLKYGHRNTTHHNHSFGYILSPCSGNSLVILLSFYNGIFHFNDMPT